MGLGEGGGDGGGGDGSGGGRDGGGGGDGGGGRGGVQSTGKRGGLADIPHRQTGKFILTNWAIKEQNPGFEGNSSDPAVLARPRLVVDHVALSQEEKSTLAYSYYEHDSYFADYCHCIRTTSTTPISPPLAPAVVPNQKILCVVPSPPTLDALVVTPWRLRLCRREGPHQETQAVAQGGRSLTWDRVAKITHRSVEGTGGLLSLLTIWEISRETISLCCRSPTLAYVALFWRAWQASNTMAGKATSSLALSSRARSWEAVRLSEERGAPHDTSFEQQDAASVQGPHVERGQPALYMRVLDGSSILLSRHPRLFCESFCSSTADNDGGAAPQTGSRSYRADHQLPLSRGPRSRTVSSSRERQLQEEADEGLPHYVTPVSVRCDRTQKFHPGGFLLLSFLHQKNTGDAGAPLDHSKHGWTTFMGMLDAKVTTSSLDEVEE